MIGIVYLLGRSGTLSKVAPIFNPSELQSPMDEILKNSDRNSGVNVSVYYGSPLDSSVLVYDLQSVSGGKSMADVFRVFLQFAEKMQNRDFDEVRLAYEGTIKFKISGGYFQRLGREYSLQNPVYTIRTFPENLRTPEGSRAYPQWEGGMIGVVGKQMEDFNDFHQKWYLNEMSLHGQ